MSFHCVQQLYRCVNLIDKLVLNLHSMNSAPTRDVDMSSVRFSSPQLLSNEAERQSPGPSLSAFDGPRPTIQSIGDRDSQNSPCEIDEELFLDEFKTSKQIKWSRNLQQLGNDPDANFQAIPSRFDTFSDHISSKPRTLDDRMKLSGEVGSLSIRQWTNRKHLRSTESVVCQEAEISQNWDLPEFMNSSRSASQQGAIELGVQMAWGLKFTAGRVHSMIRNNEQPELDHSDRSKPSVDDENDVAKPTHVELTNKFLACNDSSDPPDFKAHTNDETDTAPVDLTDRAIEPTYADLANSFVASLGNRGNIDVIRSAINLTSTGRPYCSHPGCSKQGQAKGMCIAHGGVRVCTYPNCTAISRSSGLCAAHGGRHTCSEAGCETLVRSGRKCEEHEAWRRHEMQN